jgi:hypothetical protein
VYAKNTNNNAMRDKFAGHSAVAYVPTRVLCYDRRSVGESVVEYKHPSGAYDKTFIAVRLFWVC